jgi:hypothetical protein
LATARPFAEPFAVAVGDGLGVGVGVGAEVGNPLIEIDGAPGPSVGAGVMPGADGAVVATVGVLEGLPRVASELPPGNRAQPASSADPTSATGASPHRVREEPVDMDPIFPPRRTRCRSCHSVATTSRGQPGVGGETVVRGIPLDALQRAIG